MTHTTNKTTTIPARTSQVVSYISYIIPSILASNNDFLHSRNRLSQRKRHIESIMVSSLPQANTKVHGMNRQSHHRFSECQSSRVLGISESCQNLYTCSGSEPATFKTSVLPYRGRIAFQHLSLRSAASMIFGKSCFKQKTRNQWSGGRSFTNNPLHRITNSLALKEKIHLALKSVKTLLWTTHNSTHLTSPAFQGERRVLSGILLTI
mgnify:CR=1 FL=1